MARYKQPNEEIPTERAFPARPARSRTDRSAFQSDPRGPKRSGERCSRVVRSWLSFSSNIRLRTGRARAQPREAIGQPGLHGSQQNFQYRRDFIEAHLLQVVQSDHGAARRRQVVDPIEKTRFPLLRDALRWQGFPRNYFGASP